MKYLIFLIFSVGLLSFYTPTNSYALDVTLNEIMANPPYGEKEWIEFYNNSSSPYLATSWILEERTGSDLSGTKDHALGDFTIPTKGYWTFDFSTSFLNNSGDIITIKDSDGTIIDTYQFSTTSQGKTFGRVPDGGSWNSNLDPSKATSNSNNTQSTSSPTPTLSTSSTPSPTISSFQETSKFEISNIPSQINSDTSFLVNINLELTNYPSTIFYLKGAFIKEGESNYFGLTKVNNTFVKNSSNFANQQKITTDSSGKWSGVLEVKADTEDSGFIGDGEYIFKVARYSSTGSGPTWSNQTSIYIKEVAKAKDEEESNSSQQISSTTPPQVLSATKSKATTSPKSTSFKNSVLKNSTIAGIATYSGKDLMTERPVEVKGGASPNFFLIGAGVIVLIVGAAIFVIFLKRH